MKTIFMFRSVILRIGEMHGYVCQPTLYSISQEFVVIKNNRGKTVILIVQDDNTSGFMKIVNRFHTSTHKHAKQRTQFAKCSGV
jgi:hypothetical protein